jgi:hypothetical protein
VVEVSAQNAINVKKAFERIILDIQSLSALNEEDTPNKSILNSNANGLFSWLHNLILPSIYKSS